MHGKAESEDLRRFKLILDIYYYILISTINPNNLYCAEPYILMIITNNNYILLILD